LPVILLAAAVAMAAAVTLGLRHVRGRSRPLQAPEPSVEVERHAGAPGQVAVHSTGSRPVTLRVEPQPGARSTIVEER